jgi:hypothetical protein
MPREVEEVVKVAVAAEAEAEVALMVAAAEAVPVLVAAVQEERVAKVVEQAVVLAVTMPLLPSMPKRFERSCAALRLYAQPRRRITRS